MTAAQELATLNGPALWQRFAALCQDGAAVQEQLLLTLVQRNATSRFGQQHGFANIRTLADFRQQVALQDWNHTEPYVTALIEGEADALTVAQPVLRFIHTSGTTGTPKLIPANEASQQANAVTMNLRLVALLRDHPEVLGGRILPLANPAVSGYTAGGIPYGTASGQALARPPAALAQRLAYPPAVLDISDPASRVYATLRLALAQDVRLAVGNNPHNFSQLFDRLAAHAAALIDDIRTGGLSTPTALPDELKQRLTADLQPNPERAAALQAAGALSVRTAWPDLRLILCWKTGLMSRFLAELADHCPPGVVFREYGFGASEGLFTIPVEDNSSAGVLAIHAMFFEFLPEDAATDPDTPTLLAHELEIGQRYQLVLTNTAGLYRYRLGDLVEVSGYMGQAPLLTFLQKVGDVLNLLGEKLDARQVAEAMASAQLDSGLAVRHFLWLADAQTLGYELCVEAPGNYAPTQWQTLLTGFEQHLRRLNYSYDLRRRSEQLHAPKLRVMRCGWLEALSQSAGYQAKPKIVAYQLQQAQFTDHFIAPAGDA